MTPLAYTPTPEFWALMTLIAGGLIKFFYQLAKDRKEEKIKEQARLDAITEREQTRLDLAAVAALTAGQLEMLNGRISTVDDNGKNRLKVMLGSNATTRTFVKQALTSANNTNEKILSTQEEIARLNKQLVAAQETPTEVRVVNDVSDPIPTKES